jgi:ankyrin repeat protein
MLSSTSRLLLEKNANFDIQDSEGKTALHYMAVADGNESLTRYDALMQVICKHWLLLFVLLFESEKCVSLNLSLHLILCDALHVL